MVLGSFSLRCCSGETPRYGERSSKGSAGNEPLAQLLGEQRDRLRAVSLMRLADDTRRQAVHGRASIVLAAGVVTRGSPLRATLREAVQKHSRVAGDTPPQAQPLARSVAAFLLILAINPRTTGP